VKERLTGAIILVVLIVLLVPELLSGPSRSAPVPQAAATSSEEPPLRSYTINLADDSHTGASASTSTPQANGPAQPAPIDESATGSQPAPSTSDSRPTPSPDEPQVTPQANAQPDAAREEPQPAPRKSAAAEKATAAEKLVAAEKTASAEAPIAAKPVAAQRPSAPEKNPAPYAPPERAAGLPASTEKATSTTGWMVQLGVFASRANADRLMQDLKRKGFHTSVSESTGGRRTLWRVRAGPVPERAAADQLNASLRAAGHAGSVVPK
jgi:DedD protein